MNCIECPYIKEEYKKKSDQFGEFDIEYCWCDKVGGKIWQYGMCNDGLIEHKIHNINKRNLRKRSKRERDICYKNKTKRLAYNKGNCCYSYPIVGVNKDGKPDIKNMVYFKKYSFSRRKLHLQRASNKRIRKVSMNENIKNGCNYKKYYDLKGELY